MDTQPELPLEFPKSQGTSRYDAPVSDLAEGAKRWAEKLGRTHSTEQFENIRADDSYRALYPEVRKSIGQPMTKRMQSSYESLRREIPKQYKYLTSPVEHGGLGISVEVTHENPYEHPSQMAEDVRKNKRLKVLSTESTGGHGLFSNEENDMFRAIHDAFGHLATARDFTRHGEEAAYSSHASMFSKKALPALVSETRAQNTYLIHAGDFPPNAPINVPDWATKVGNMPPEPKKKKPKKAKQLKLKF